MTPATAAPTVASIPSSARVGLFRGYPDRIYLDGRSKLDNYQSPDDYKQYVHPLWQKLEQAALAAGGHGGMDFVLNWRLIDCLRNGLPLDIDVYDTAAWSSVSALSVIRSPTAAPRFPSPISPAATGKSCSHWGSFREKRNTER